MRALGLDVALLLGRGGWARTSRHSVVMELGDGLQACRQVGRFADRGALRGRTLAKDRPPRRFTNMAGLRA